ncbi:MAG: hypothetical protein J5759_04715 [Bacteroidales bacterium]|nr:hypothetical protein [Bacteroidales bacterium]
MNTKTTTTLFVVSFVAFLSLVFSCTKEHLVASDKETRQEALDLFTKGDTHNPGIQLVNPYSLEIMQEASDSLCNVLSMPHLQIEPTHVYLRFLPADSTEYNSLLQYGYELFDYPLDYLFYNDGHSYHDDDLDEDQMTWQYACIEIDTSIPQVYYEVLDTCVIPLAPFRGESSLETLASNKNNNSDIFNQQFDSMMEALACEIANSRNGMSSKKLEQIRAGLACHPQGYVWVKINNVARPLKGVTIKTWHFVKTSETYTDENGYYYIPKTYSQNLNYAVRFENQKGFQIYNFVIDLTPSCYRLCDSYPSMGHNITIQSNNEQWLSAVVNNITYDYYTMCQEDGRQAPPNDLKITTLTTPSYQGSGASMLHHLGYQNLSQYSTTEIMSLILDAVPSAIISTYSGIMKYLLPDIVVQNQPTYDKIVSKTYHELSHASHYASSGQNVWNILIAETLRNSCPDNGYGDGTNNDLMQNVGELSEAWAYANQALHGDRLQLSYSPPISVLWFKPSIFAIQNMVQDTVLTEANFLSCMTPTTQSVDELYNKLVTAYPSKKALITDRFASHGALTSQTNWYVVNNTSQTVYAGFLKNGKSWGENIAPADTCFFTSIPYVTTNFNNAFPDYYPSVFGMSINGTPIYIQYNGTVYKPLNRPFFNASQWSSSTFTTTVGNTTIRNYYFTLSPSDII